MRKLCIAVLLCVLWAVPASAQYLNTVQLTIDSTAAGVGFTASTLLASGGHPQINSASCISNSAGGEFRYRMDGIAPTTTMGVPVPAGGGLSFTNLIQMLNFKGIRTGGTSAVLTCTLSDVTVAQAPPGGAAGGGGGGSGSGCVGTAGTPCVVTGNGTAGTADAGVVSVQGIASGTALTVAPSSGSFATDGTFGSAAPATGPAVGVRAETTMPTAESDGELVMPMADVFGRLRPANVCQDPALVTSVVISTASSGNVELVAISGSTVVTVCGFNVISAGTVGVQFIVGTGTACATNELNKTGVYPFVANGGINSGFGAPVFKGAAGDAVCVELSTTVQIDGILTYVQQ